MTDTEQADYDRLSKRVAELHDAVDIALAHLGVVNMGQLKGDSRDCVAHAYEVLSNVV